MKQGAAKIVYRAGDRSATQVQVQGCELAGITREITIGMGCDSIPLIALSLLIADCEIEVDGQIKINAVPVSEELGRKVLAALQARFRSVDAELPEISDEIVNRHLDIVLRAAGSALRHYTLPKSLDDMRAAMRAAMNVAQPASCSVSVARDLVAQAADLMDYSAVYDESEDHQQAIRVVHQLRALLTRDGV